MHWNDTGAAVKNGQEWTFTLSNIWTNVKSSYACNDGCVAYVELHNCKTVRTSWNQVSSQIKTKMATLVCYSTSFAVSKLGSLNK